MIFKIIAHTKILSKDQKLGASSTKGVKVALLAGRLDMVGKILTFGVIAFKATAEAFPTLENNETGLVS